ASLGVEMAVQPGRYRYIACLLVACWYSSIIVTIPAQRLRVAMLIPALIFSIWFWHKSYTNYAWQLRHFRDDYLLTDIYKWCLGEDGLTYPWRDRAYSIMNES